MDIQVFYVDGLDLRCVEGRRDDVILEIKVLDHSVLHDHLFHQGVPQSHHHATFNLTFHHDRIDRLADIERGDQVENIHRACLDVHLHFRHLGTVGIDKIRGSLTCL